MIHENSAAVVFPGQGSQRPGMGKDFFDNVPISRQTFEEASDALGWDVAALCFSEDERLNLTEFTQPCIVSTEIAMFRAVQTLFSFSPSSMADTVSVNFQLLLQPAFFHFRIRCASFTKEAV
jgi:[acyl-carrier-protein] S-malonyltransferase/trans-AT polyketide synthase/acyltransferase/oxidoreductase domain-containing protein